MKMFTDAKNALQSMKPQGYVSQGGGPKKVADDLCQKGAKFEKDGLSLSGKSKAAYAAKPLAVEPFDPEVKAYLKKLAAEGGPKKPSFE